MADEKDPSTPKEPASGAESAATGRRRQASGHRGRTSRRHRCRFHAPGADAANDGRHVRGGVQSAPAPRSNAASGVTDPAPRGRRASRPRSRRCPPAKAPEARAVPPRPAAPAPGARGSEAGGGGERLPPRLPQVDDRRLGRLLRRLHVGPRGQHALPVPERALRAAAVLQGGLPQRVHGGRGRHALEGRLRRVDRAQLRRLLRPDRGVHAPRLLAELAGRGEQVQVPLPRERLLQDGRQLRGPARGRWSARASCSPTTARSWSTSR